MNLIYEGSVKDIYQLEKNEELSLSFRIGFQFLIGGAMPNEIPSGESLARMLTAFFDDSQKSSGKILSFRKGVTLIY